MNVRALSVKQYKVMVAVIIALASAYCFLWALRPMQLSISFTMNNAASPPAVSSSGSSIDSAATSTIHEISNRSNAAIAVSNGSNAATITVSEDVSFNCNYEYGCYTVQLLTNGNMSSEEHKYKLQVIDYWIDLVLNRRKLLQKFVIIYNLIDTLGDRDFYWLHDYVWGRCPDDCIVLMFNNSLISRFRYEHVRTKWVLHVDDDILPKRSADAYIEAHYYKCTNQHFVSGSIFAYPIDRKIGENAYTGSLWHEVGSKNLNLMRSEIDFEPEMILTHAMITSVEQLEMYMSPKYNYVREQVDHFFTGEDLSMNWVIGDAVFRTGTTPKACTLDFQWLHVQGKNHSNSLWKKSGQQRSALLENLRSFFNYIPIPLAQSSGSLVSKPIDLTHCKLPSNLKVEDPVDCKSDITFHVILMGGNLADDILDKSLGSVFRQSLDYTGTIRAWYFDDGSTNTTYLKSKCEENVNLTCYLLPDNKGPAHTKETAFRTLYDNMPSNVNPNDVIAILDADDEFMGSGVFTYLNKEYHKSPCWITYGGMIGKYDEQIQDISLLQHGYGSDFRNSAWLWGHLRTFRAHLLHHILSPNLYSMNGEYLQKFTDRGFLYNILDLSRMGHICFTTRKLYQYTWYDKKNTASKVTIEQRGKLKAYTSSLSCFKPLPPTKKMCCGSNYCVL